jgi:hypothetical protein
VLRRAALPHPHTVLLGPGAEPPTRLPASAQAALRKLGSRRHALPRRGRAPPRARAAPLPPLAARARGAAAGAGAARGARPQARRGRRPRCRRRPPRCRRGGVEDERPDGDLARAAIAELLRLAAGPQAA